MFPSPLVVVASKLLNIRRERWDMGIESVKIGRCGEDIAERYLSGKGYEIIERNYRSQQGEIDLIAKEGNYLVFIEVKNYSFRSFGNPLGAVNKAKKDSMVHAARTYLYKTNICNINCRFDVLAIYNYESFQLIRNAFYVS
jgi:putative endonuclease